jgi:WD40 repeat protein
MAEQALTLLKSISGHSGAIYDIAAVDNYVYTTSADRFVVRWNIEKGLQDNFAVKLDHSAFNIALDDNRKQLIIGNSKGGIHCIDLESREEVRYITQHKSSIFALTYDKYKNVFYSGDQDGYFCAWDAKSMKLLITLPFDCGKIRQICVEEGGGHIAICGHDGKLRILETEFFNEIQCLSVNKQGVNTAVFNGESIVVGGKDAHITRWNWREGKLLKSIPAHNYAVYDLAITNNSQQLISVSFDKTIKCWSFPELDIIQRVEFKNDGHRHTVNRIAKIDDDTIATVSDDALIKLWRVKLS